MAVFQHASPSPFARAIQYRALTIACSSTASTVAPPSRVLLSMPEQELQQLVLQFGQEGYRGKQLHHLLYKSKVKEIQESSNLPLAFRNELQEAGWSVGRSPVYKEVTAADGTVKAFSPRTQESKRVVMDGQVIKLEKYAKHQIAKANAIEVIFLTIQPHLKFFEKIGLFKLK